MEDTTKKCTDLFFGGQGCLRVEARRWGRGGGWQIADWRDRGLPNSNTTPVKTNIAEC